MSLFNFIIHFATMWSLAILGMALFLENREYAFKPRPEILPFAGCWFGLGLALTLLGNIAMQTIAPNQVPTTRIATYVLWLDPIVDALAAPMMLGSLIAILSREAERPWVRASIYISIVGLSLILSILVALGVR